MSKILANERATIELAELVGALLPNPLAGWTVLLAGELGASAAAQTGILNLPG